MSLQAISWALDFSESAANNRLVLIVMCHHTDELGFSGLSKATLADETRLSESSVIRAQQVLVDLHEIEHASADDAPAWWLGIPVNRRPKLFRMSGFLGSQYATPIHRRARGVTGVSRGSRGGVAGVSDQAADQGIRDVNREQTTENSSCAPPENEKGEPRCPQCQDSGSFFLATAGTEVECDHRMQADDGEPAPPPWTQTDMTYREWVDAGSPSPPPPLVSAR